MNSFVRIIGLKVLRIFDQLIAAFAANKIILDKEDFPFYETLRDNHELLLNEFKLARGEKMQCIKDFFVYEKGLVEDDNWQAVPIFLFSYLFKENALKYPKTYKITSSLPGCCSAMISVLGPGKNIPVHRGIYKGVYRCLFTLQVQQDADCWIRVDKEKLFFREGESIVFDETVEHEVMNASSQPRVVLFLDFYRKLPFPLNLMNDVVFSILRKSPFVTNLLNKYKKLENVTLEPFTPVEAILP